jgi:hypothetical protein
VTTGPTGLAQVTGTASHEIIESSTDPFPDTKPVPLNPVENGTPTEVEMQEQDDRARALQRCADVRTARWMCCWR